MITRWSSEGLSEQDQFAGWREAWHRLVYAMTPERDGGGPFRAAIETVRFGGLVIVKLSSEGHRIRRDPADIAAEPADSYALCCQQTDRIWFRQGEREFVAEPGDVVAADPNEPVATGTAGEIDLHLWRIPRAMLDPFLACPGFLPLTHLGGRTGIGAVLWRHLAAVAAEAALIDAIAQEAIALNLVRLVAVALGAAPKLREIGRDIVRSTKLDQALRYIDGHLPEPDLTPTRVAAALGISIRQLHLLFEPTATSFAQWVQRRRVEECRAMLVNPAAADRSIADIAFAWGFNDLSTFYRVFRRIFGAAPRDMRAAHPDGRETTQKNQ